MAMWKETRYEDITVVNTFIQYVLKGRNLLLWDRISTLSLIIDQPVYLQWTVVLSWNELFNVYKVSFNCEILI